jgi:hypothetical protein
MASYQDRSLKAETVTLCPICGGKTATEGKNGFSLCLLHSWVKGHKTITLKGRV